MEVKLETKERIISLYNYISEASKLSKTINKSVLSERWHLFFEDIPIHKNIECNKDTYKDSNKSILEIKKPVFLKPLEIKQENLEWIDGDWKDYKRTVTVREQRVVVIKEKTDTDEGITEVKTISEEQKKEILKEIKKRDVWVQEQKNIEKIQRLFNEIYIQYLDLKKESENYELILGNGIVKVKKTDIYYPVLLRKVKIEFIAKDNIIKIKEMDPTLGITSELYTDFLNEAEQINLVGVSDLNDKVIENNIHPLDEKDIGILFREFIHKLSLNGVYAEDIQNYTLVDNVDILYDRPLFFIRKKENGIVKAIDQIVENIKENDEIPNQLIELVGIDDAYMSRVNVSQDSVKQVKNSDKESEKILFVKESNNEQMQIAKQIAKHNAAVVQGPPGTGKTHTIANLLGHFLAQGKNVLVTSQTKKALKVLKSKLPDNIKGLCISILDDDNNDLRSSVENITENIGRLSSKQLAADVELLSDMRDKECDNLNKIKKHIFGIKFAENQSIFYNGEGFSVKDVGKYLKENEKRLDKITGTVVDNTPCPITNEDLNFLRNYREKVSLEEEKEIALYLTDVSNFKSAEDFEKLVDEYQLKFNNLKNVLHNNPEIIDGKLIIDGKYGIDLNKFNSCEFKDAIIPEKLKNLKEWHLKIILYGAIKNENQIIMMHFLNELKDLTGFINKESIKFFGNRIDYALSIEDSRNLILELKAGIENPGFLFLKNKLNKAKENLGDKVLLNNKKIETIEHCDLVLNYLELENRKDDLKRKWDYFQIKDISMTDLLNNTEEIIRIINFYLKWYDEKKDQFISSIKELGIDLPLVIENNTNELLSSKISSLPEKIRKIEELTQIANIALEYIDIKEKYFKYEQYIKTIIKSGSVNENLLYECIKIKDVEGYRKTLPILYLLSEKKKFYIKRQGLLERIRNVAESWAAEIESGVFFDCDTDINEVWKWKQLSQELEKIKNEPYEKLTKQAVEVKKKIKQLTLELVEKKSWYHVLSFVEKKENLPVNQALRGWKQSMQKIGKGTGKNAELHRKQAKEKMAICQKAVPVWIMPMSKVIDTLNPAKNKFDIVIIDEASQCDISSLVLLYMAKKVIIVGDDKQVSPSAVGKKIEVQNKLREKYLAGKITNDDLYDVRSSLYSIAITTYQPLMLREHFRCVPEIIGYSNKTSYDNKIKPLRESNSSKLKPAVINYRVDGKRDGNKKINQVEAETIVSLIAACLEEKLYEEATFGVISLLGTEQIDLIQNMLVDRIGNAEIEKHNILCGDPSHFQGDERDVMFLTMVDSNDDPSTPLRKRTEGIDNLDKKRYNVAASRAKDQMWIVNSLDPTYDLKDGDLRRELLEFAQNPKSFMVDESVSAKSDSVFEEEVAKYLLAKDYNLEQQWEVGAYRIDMVVSYKDKKIAIECDGERWHSSEEQIKNDIERQEILERCGWTFIRIRGSRYFRNPQLTMEEVVAELEEHQIYPEKSSVQLGEAKTEDFGVIEKIKNRAREILEEWKNDESEIEEIEEEIEEVKKEEFKFEEKLQIEEVEEVKETVSKEPQKEIIVSHEVIESSDENMDVDIISFLHNENLEYIDNREKSNILWVIYSVEDKNKVESFLKAKEYQFSLDRRGNKTTDGRKAWRIKMEG